MKSKWTLFALFNVPGFSALFVQNVLLWLSNDFPFWLKSQILLIYFSPFPSNPFLHKKYVMSIFHDLFLPYISSY